MALFTEDTTEVSRLPEGVVIDAEYYDESYFEAGKSGWDYQYTFENTYPIFSALAKFLVEGFPLSESVLDVGCAKGFLLRHLRETLEINEFDWKLEGFDISEYAIDHAEEEVKDIVSVASVDDFQFKRKYDLMVCTDVFEHLTSEQSLGFLSRAREFVNDSIFAIIDDNPDEESHINIQTREEWNEIFHEAGWSQDVVCKWQLRCGMEHRFIKERRWRIFIFRSGNNERFSDVII